MYIDLFLVSVAMYIIAHDLFTKNELMGSAITFALFLIFFIGGIYFGFAAFME